MTDHHILQGDVMDGLRTLPDGCVQCTVTSPPYFGLRQYLFDGAVIIKRCLTEEERIYLLSELKKCNVRPKYGGTGK
jgi:DNA modification methylase